MARLLRSGQPLALLGAAAASALPLCSTRMPLCLLPCWHSSSPPLLLKGDALLTAHAEPLALRCWNHTAKEGTATPVTTMPTTQARTFHTRPGHCTARGGGQAAVCGQYERGVAMGLRREARREARQAGLRAASVLMVLCALHAAPLPKILRHGTHVLEIEHFGAVLIVLYKCDDAVSTTPWTCELPGRRREHRCSPRMQEISQNNSGRALRL